MYLVLHNFLYDATDWPRRDIVEMKVRLTFVILSIRGPIRRACSVEEDIEAFPVVHRKNGLHQMRQWVVAIKVNNRRIQVENSTHVKSLDT